MGPEGSVLVSTAFSEKLPPAFDGHSNYSAYRQDVDLWLALTSLEERKRGPALIGRLSGEAKASAKTLTMALITAHNGASKILEHLDKMYKVDETDQLDIDLADFLDYSWLNSMPVDQFIAGFHSRLDRIASLNIDFKLKGHLLLRQAALDTHTRNMIVGASSGKYDVTNISNSLRQAYRNTPKPSSMTSQTPEKPAQTCFPCKKEGLPYNHKKYSKDCPKHLPRNPDAANENHSTPRAFYAFKTSSSASSCRAIIDSGACTSVVGKETLDRTMQELQITEIKDATPKMTHHRFGNHDEDQTSIFAVEFPFEYQTRDKKTRTFKIHFDVIQGSLPFLIGFPSLKAMGANVSFIYMTIGLKLFNEYTKIPLEHDQHHLYLAFKSTHQSYYSTHANSAENLGTPSSYSNRARRTYCPVAESSTDIFDARDLKKLHLQLKHGTHSAMREWIRSTGKWVSDVARIVSLLSWFDIHVGNKVVSMGSKAPGIH